MTTKIKSRVRRSYRRADTWDALAERVGLSRTHVFEVIHGTRNSTPEKIREIRAWANENAKKGRDDSPAVVAALTNLKTAA